MKRDGNAAQIVSDEVRAFRDEIRNLRATPSITGSEIRARLAPYEFARPVPIDRALTDVIQLMREGTLHPTHPRYFGLFVPGVHEAGIWADTLAALYNPQVGAWWHAPAANEIEIHTLRYLAATMGYDAKTAHFTSGGSEANLTALLAAIAKAYPHSLESGVGDAAAHGIVYISSEAHHSFHKAARVSGLGTKVLRSIGCNARYEMNVDSLRDTIDRDSREGHRPMMIVATFGTTTGGAIDDVAAVGEIASECGAWFHVDAAWGGAVGFSRQLRSFLKGIEHADSITWDAHKWLSVPMGAGMFFSRHANAVDGVFDVDAGYVPKKIDEGEDLYLTSLQWSRRFIGLKVFLTLATLGRDAIEKRIDRQLEVAEYLRQKLVESGWAIVNDSPLPVVCFGRPSLRSYEDVNAIVQTIVARGRAWISAARLDGQSVLRACITHDETSQEDIDILCEELATAVRSRE